MIKRLQKILNYLKQSTDKEKIEESNYGCYKMKETKWKEQKVQNMLNTKIWWKRLQKKKSVVSIIRN